jgi:hypothetical protein
VCVSGRTSSRFGPWYGADLVALQGGEHVLLAPPLAVLERERLRRRFFVAMMCLYALDLEEELEPRPVRRRRAERCARRSLMPGRDFAGALDLADDGLAEAFNVPLSRSRLDARSCVRARATRGPA